MGAAVQPVSMLHSQHTNTINATGLDLTSQDSSAYAAPLVCDRARSLSLCAAPAPLSVCLVCLGLLASQVSQLLAPQVVQLLVWFKLDCVELARLFGASKDCVVLARLGTSKKS
eukprot:2918037-Rhodomonas_salina.1